MPTIDQLDPAVAVTDDDILPISQSGEARRATRGQLLAGFQTQLAITPGLLGRITPGAGAPEQIGVGANLKLAGGVLSGPTPFHIANLPAASPPGISDILAISQAGQDASVPLGAVLAALSNVPGIDLSTAVVRTGQGGTRSLSDWLSDSVPVEAFGAVGDGSTDDGPAFDRAIASGRPVRLGPRTYLVNGQRTVSTSTVLIGTPGQSVLRRATQTGGAWFSVGGPSFTAIGVTFDAGHVAGDSWGVLVLPTCTSTLIENCTFKNATGQSLGTGLTIQAQDGLSGAMSSHRVRHCSFIGNAVHGLWIQAAGGALVEGCIADQNGVYGINLDITDPTFQQIVRSSAVVSSRATRNQRGISIGNYNQTNTQPPVWGPRNPDAIGILVAGNVCADNTAYGIAAAGANIQVLSNTIGSSAGSANGILLNAVSSCVSDNVVRGPGQFGIDAGGCLDSEIGGNLVTGFAVGINPGGGTGVRVAGNRLTGNVWGITAYQVETDGQGNNFGIACNNLRLERNLIQLKDGTGGGIYLVDGPQNVSVVENDFEGASTSSASQALWAHTDSVVIRGNRWNSQARMICNPVSMGSGTGQVQFPDMIDGLMITSATQPVASLSGQHQVAMAGQISFIRVTSGGTGYTRASVTVNGSGTGAQATAYIRNGTVIGVTVSAAGAGYAASGTTVSIIGDGTGATATAFVGLPVPEGRRLRVQCNSAIQFKRAGSIPFQDNWTGTDMTVPPTSEIVWAGTWGGWQAISFISGDYVSPAGDGSVSLRSLVGDITLRPASGGHVRVGSDTEAMGYISTLGRGSPQGVVSAPPGSDYRNLDGGVGSTLWVKQSGTGSTGWIAVA